MSNKINVSVKIVSKQCTQLSFKANFWFVQNIWVSSQCPKRCESVSSWLQKLHKSESTTLHISRHLFVGRIRCSSLSWNHLNSVSIVVCLALMKICFQFKGALCFSFHLLTATGMTSWPTWPALSCYLSQLKVVLASLRVVDLSCPFVAPSLARLTAVSVPNSLQAIHCQTTVWALQGQEDLGLTPTVRKQCFADVRYWPPVPSHTQTDTQETMDNPGTVDLKMNTTKRPNSWNWSRIA